MNTLDTIEAFIVETMMMVGKLIDKKTKGETEVDPKTKKRIPKMSLATKIVNQYREAKQRSPRTYRNTFTLDHLDRLHELALRRAENLKIPTVKELIMLEEKSVRTPTVKEILKGRPLDELAEVKKALPFAEEEVGETAEGDVTEVEEEEKEGEEEQEPGEGTNRGRRRNRSIMKVRKRTQGHL